jgi:hypothetical protein
MKLKSIWAVEQGSNSDYHVVGVFSSEANAQLVVDVIKKSEYCGDTLSIIEWPLNPCVAELNKGYIAFSINMLRDGTVECCNITDISSYDLTISTFYLWQRTKVQRYKNKNIPDCLKATVLAKDQKHAIKIVNEHRAQMIAYNEWSA